MNRNVLDVIRLLSIVEGLHGLLKVGITGGDTSDHQAVGVTSERLLQDGCKLTLSVRHMLES